MTAAQRASGFKGKMAAIAQAATQVNRAIFFSAAIIVAGFIPLFTMSGVEGHIFGPMARTYAYAIAGRLDRHLHRHAGAIEFSCCPRASVKTETFVVRWMRKAYSPMVANSLLEPTASLRWARRGSSS